MRTRKFRAWCKKTVNNRISLPINKSHSEFELSKEQMRSEGKFDEWYENRNERTNFLMANFNEYFPNTEETTVTYEMLYENVSIFSNGQTMKPYHYEVLEIMDYVETLDAYEGDLLYGKDNRNGVYIYGTWCGVVKFSDIHGRIMVWDKDIDRWFDIDDYSFYRVQTIEKLDIK